MSPSHLLAAYAKIHDQLRRGESAESLEPLFASDATMRFVNIPFPDLPDRNSIIKAFRNHPPDDDLMLTDVRELGDTCTALYGWASAPHRIEGSIQLTTRNGLILEITITSMA